MSGVDAVLLTVSNENSINFPNLKTYGIVDGALIESIADSSSSQSNAVTYNITPGDTLSIRAKNIWNEVELKNKNNITRTSRSNIRQKVKGVSQTYKTYNKALEKGLDPDKVLRETNVEWKVKRVIRTESHEQFEIANVDVHKAMGLTHKVWNTQGDKIVRDTPFHNAVGDKRIPIDSQFRANGIRADHPGDMMLPVGERINCRCYLTFE
jgi:hypothetical protein